MPLSPTSSPMPTSSSTSPVRSATWHRCATRCTTSTSTRSLTPRSWRYCAASTRRRASCTPRPDRCTDGRFDLRWTSFTPPDRWTSTGSSKLAGEQLHLVYHTAYGMPTTSLRLTNVYGPRQRLTSDEAGLLARVHPQSMLGEEIRIFGDGAQRRDCVYVDDVVEALLAATAPEAIGRVFNVGNVIDHRWPRSPRRSSKRQAATVASR